MNDNRGPIFIGGVAASGKTQLRVVLGAHPDLSLTRRTKLWNRYYGRFGALSDPGNLDRCVAAMAADEDVQRLNPDWDRLRREYRTGEDDYARLFAALHQQHAQRQGKRRWGEQLQFVECFADPVFAAFPDARLIHMVRHPAATIASRRKVGWDVATWLHSAVAARNNQRRYGERYRVVHYEALAARPTETVREICAFIGESFTAAMAEVLADLHLDPPDVGGDRAVASFVDMYAGRTLFELGYEREVRPARERFAQVLPIWPVNRLTMTAWRVTRGAPLTRQVNG
jgi:hypothetical protein